MLVKSVLQPLDLCSDTTGWLALTFFCRLFSGCGLFLGFSYRRLGIFSVTDDSSTLGYINHFLELCVHLIVVVLVEAHGQRHVFLFIDEVELIRLQEDLILFVLLLELVFAGVHVGFEPAGQVALTELTCRQVAPHEVKLTRPVTSPVGASDL